jgi:hypothetical protein
MSSTQNQPACKPKSKRGPARFPLWIRRSAEELLAALRKRLDGPIAPEIKRRIVEALVDRIQANTVEKWGVQQSELIITYRFSEPAESTALIVPRFHG